MAAALPSTPGSLGQHQTRRQTRKISKQRQHAKEKLHVAARVHTPGPACGTSVSRSSVPDSPLGLAAARLSPGAAQVPRRGNSSTARPCAPAGRAIQEEAGAQGASEGSRERGSGGGRVEEEGAVGGEQEIKRGKERPLWSVVIPTYNRLPILRKCLAALEAQELTGEDGAPVLDFEVVVVDDGSSDGTVEFLGQQGAPDPPHQGGADLAQPGQAVSHRQGGPVSRQGEGLTDYATAFPHARLFCQEHGGAAVARNLGVQRARGSIVVFIDSDLVVSPNFLAAHWQRLKQAQEWWGDERSFSYGRVVNTSNFEDPQSEPFKLTDLSAAFFATGNVAIARSMLQEAAHLLRPLRAGPGSPGAPTAAALSSHTALGLNEAAQPMHPGKANHSTGADAAVDTASLPDRAVPAAASTDGKSGAESGGVPWVGPGPFDPEFRTYGWEDLELGERLRLCGARIVQCPEAVGFHWHRAFSLDQLEGDIRRERERGRNAVRFFLKHPDSWHVRLMLQLTPFHWFLWGLLTLGGLVSEDSLRPLLQSLLARGQVQAAGALLVPVFNWHYMLAMEQELKRMKG